MQRYFLHIFIGFALMAVVFVLVGAYQFMSTGSIGPIPIEGQPAKPIPGNVVGDELDISDFLSDDVGTPAPPTGKLKADVFVGKLEKVDTGCFADGECFIEVDGKHVTVLRGWSQEIVGTVKGVAGFGDLENHLGEMIEVYAQVNPDMTYTLYGSEGFYVKLADMKGMPAVPPKQTAGAGCVIGGCSGQLCVDAGAGDVVSTCEWTESYACYKTAQCERQSNGQCGWTETTELNQCLLQANETPSSMQVQ